MIVDCFRNISVIPASLVFDRFTATLHDAGRIELALDGRFRIIGATLTDYRRVYAAALNDVLSEVTPMSRRIVFVDECMPQNCVYHAEFPSDEFTDPSNVVRWLFDDSLNVPVREINWIVVATAQSVLKTWRNVLYLLNTAVCERYMLDGVMTVLGPRLANPDIKYMSSQWHPVNRIPDGKPVDGQREPVRERDEALKYMLEMLDK